MSKTHIVSQEEGIKDVGVQVRASDPISPVADQTWINKTQRRLKTRDGSETIILASGPTATAVLSGATLDAVLADSFSDVVTGAKEYTISNLQSGKRISLLVQNTDDAAAAISFTNAVIYDENENSQVDANSDKLFTIFNIDGEYYVSGTQY